MFYEHLIMNNMIDSTKETRKKNDKAFTYNGNENKKSSRIDYILTSRRLLSSINGYELLNGIALNSDHNLTKITMNRRLQPKNYNNFFKQEYLSDPIFNERVEDEIYIHIARIGKQSMPVNDSRSLDETIEDEVDTQDLNLDFLYNLIQESYFKINDSRKKNKF